MKIKLSLNSNATKQNLRLMFGLRWYRMIQWWRDIYSEKPGVNEFYHMTLMAIKALFNPIKKNRWMHRMNICYHCPVFNKTLRNCRKGEQGCGCFVPYKALAEVDCWLREQDGKSGWGIADKA